VHALLCRRFTDVVDADLSKYVDRRALRLIKLWLRAPVEGCDSNGRRRMTDGKGRRRAALRNAA
jgi:RNA-directed DNA polymerase